MRDGSNGSDGGKKTSGPLPKLNFAQFIQMVYNKLHYCHPYVLCNNKINACRTSTRKQGHKEESKVTNRIGGATAVPAALSALGLKMKLQGGTGDTYENKENLMNLMDQSLLSPPTSSPLKSRTNQTKIADPANSLIFDTGTTGNFAAVSSNICTNVQPVKPGVSVLLPDKSYMHSTHVGELPLPHLPAATRKVHLFPKMGRELLAITVLCNHGCQAIFKASGLVVKENSTGRTILTVCVKRQQDSG